MSGSTSTLAKLVPSSTYPCNGGSADAVFIQQAITDAGAGGVVQLQPMISGGTQVPYNCQSTLTLTNGCSLMGTAPGVQMTFRVGSGIDCITYGFVPPSDTNLTLGYLANLALECGNQGRDGIRIVGGIRLRIDHTQVLNAGQDGLHIQGSTNGNFTEDCMFYNMSVRGSTRHLYHLEAGASSTAGIKSLLFLNCLGKSPATGQALKLTANNSAGGSSIVNVKWSSGELDCNGSSAADCVAFTTNGATISKIDFDTARIGNSSGTNHTGAAINSGGTAAATQVACQLFGMSNNAII